MKAEFELVIDEKTKEPKIKFRHHDKDTSLDQTAIKAFVELAKERGILLVNPDGGIITGYHGDSWENYEIKIK